MTVCLNNKLILKKWPTMLKKKNLDKQLCFSDPSSLEKGDAILMTPLGSSDGLINAGGQKLRRQKR